MYFCGKVLNILMYDDTNEPSPQSVLVMRQKLTAYIQRKIAEVNTRIHGRAKKKAFVSCGRSTKGHAIAKVIRSMYVKSPYVFLMKSILTLAGRLLSEHERVKTASLSWACCQAMRFSPRPCSLTSEAKL